MKHRRGKEQEKYVVVKQIWFMEKLLWRQKGWVTSACLMSCSQHRLCTVHHHILWYIFHSVQTPHSLRKNYSVYEPLYKSTSGFTWSDHISAMLLCFRSNNLCRTEAWSQTFLNTHFELFKIAITDLFSHFRATETSSKGDMTTITK